MGHYVSTIGLRDVGSWHGREFEQGEIFTGEVDIWETMQRIGMDYDIHLSPNYFEWNGEMVNVPGRFHVIIPPNQWNESPKSIREVANRYSVIQNKFVADLLEPLNKEWPLETLGVLKEGKIVWVELRMPPFEIAGNPNELHEHYLLYANDHTMNAAVFDTVTTRVQCFNTFRAALGSDTITIPHSTDVANELEFRTTVIQSALNARKSHKDVLEKMFLTKVISEDITRVVEATFPDPSKPRSYRIFNSVDPMGLDHTKNAVSDMADRVESDMNTWERAVERQKELRADIVDEFFKFNDEQPYAGNTLYSLWNGVTATVNHSDKFYGGNPKNAVSLLFGQKNQILQNAWKTCTELIK